MYSDVSDVGFVFAVRACPLDAVAMVGHTLERQRFGLDGDAVLASTLLVNQEWTGSSQRETSFFSNWMRFLLSQWCRLKCPNPSRGRL